MFRTLRFTKYLYSDAFLICALKNVHLLINQSFNAPIIILLSSLAKWFRNIDTMNIFGIIFNKSTYDCALINELKLSYSHNNIFRKFG